MRSTGDALGRAECLVSDLYGAHLSKSLFGRANAEFAILVLTEAKYESFALLNLLAQATALIWVICKEDSVQIPLLNHRGLFVSLHRSGALTSSAIHVC